MLLVFLLGKEKEEEKKNKKWKRKKLKSSKWMIEKENKNDLLWKRKIYLDNNSNKEMMERERKMEYKERKKGGKLLLKKISDGFDLVF